MNLQTLTAKARAVRGDVIASVSTKGSRTQTPLIFERDEQIKLRERTSRLSQNGFSCGGDISVVTGWRTADVCNLGYSSIDWESGMQL